jgi:hypothetical protein
MAEGKTLNWEKIALNQWLRFPQMTLTIAVHL